MNPKTFELTIEERNTLCHALEHVMDTNFNCNARSDGTWVDAGHKTEQEELQALYLKLMPKSTAKSGWVLKERLVGEVWQAIPAEDTSDFQFITWVEEE